MCAILAYLPHNVLNVKAVVAAFNAFNQEKALVKGLLCDCENFVDLRFQLYCSRTELVSC